MNLQHENERFFRRLNPSSPSAEINKNGFSAVVFKMVGMTGFEPATPSSRTKCTTKPVSYTHLGPEGLEVFQSTQACSLRRI